MGKGEERRGARGNDGALIGGRGKSGTKRGEGETQYTSRVQNHKCVRDDLILSPESRQLADGCATGKGRGAWEQAGVGKGGTLKRCINHVFNRTVTDDCVGCLEIHDPLKFDSLLAAVSVGKGRGEEGGDTLKRRSSRNWDCSLTWTIWSKEMVNHS